jgi:hypothetical protein
VKTAIVLLTALAAALNAQSRDTARTKTAAAKHVKPVDALFQSLFIPGWGQASTGRNVAGAAFVVWEGVAIMMTTRAVQERNYMRESGSANVDSKSQQVQDWVVLIVFNHLFSAAEAYVAAHLQDFPKELKLRAVPRGIGLSLPVP